MNKTAHRARPTDNCSFHHHFCLFITEFFFSVCKCVRPERWTWAMNETSGKNRISIPDDGILAPSQKNNNNRSRRSLYLSHYRVLRWKYVLCAHRYWCAHVTGIINIETSNADEPIPMMGRCVEMLHHKLKLHHC